MPIQQAFFETPSYVVAASTVLPVLDLMTLILRFHVRRRFKQGLKADDWLICFATILTLGMGGTLTYGVVCKSIAYRYDAPEDHDPFSIATPQLVLTGKIQIAVLLMLPLILGFIKTSFLAFYIRVFSVNKKERVHRLLLGSIVFVTLWSAAFFFAQLFGCRLEFYAYWRSTNDLLTKCVKTEQMILAMSITDFVTDIVLIVIPLPLIWKLNLSWKKKFSISVIFLLGVLSVAASLTRLAFTVDIVRTGFSRDADPICDFSLNYSSMRSDYLHPLQVFITNGLYWGIVECSVGILAAHLPTLQFILRVPAWEAALSAGRGILEITSSKTQLLKSKASKLSLHRGSRKAQIDWHDLKNDSLLIVEDAHEELTISIGEC